MFHMDTHRLRYFCTIAETGSLTKASEILGISHSGLSKAITALEDETNLQLFRPQGRGLEITKDGKWFYQKAQEILKIENEIDELMLPYKVDLSIYHKIDDVKFKEHIDRVGVEF